MAIKSKVKPGAGAHSDALSGTYHFLDVGGAKYGDCTLVEFGDIRILIDGGHPADFKGQPHYPSIPDQLREILGEPPHHVTLIVVTHCHADHIGCMPELVANGIVVPRFALLTDPKLGFGRKSDEAPPPSDGAEPEDVLAALLREEDVSDLADDELESFIDAVARVEARYGSFVKDLTEQGANVSLYRGGPLGAELGAAIEPTGALLLGPSEAQLLLCAEQISTTNREAEDAASDLARADRPGLAQLYRAIAAEDDDAARNPRGSGMNCQSIAFAFGPPDARVLLAGDMQFVEPGVNGLDEEIAQLRQAAIGAGPYSLFKTTHHTSHNGQDDDLLDALGSPRLIVHSGGIRDEDHPYPGVLKVLKRRQGVSFARTDRNGHITARPGAPDAGLVVSKGTINDFAPNVVADEPAPTPARTQGSASALQIPSNGGQIVIVNLPPGPVDMTVAGVEIRVRVPGSAERSARPARQPGVARPEARVQRAGGADTGVEAIAPGRSISKLLFVTDPDRLIANIGRDEATSALSGIEARGGELLRASGPDLAGRAKERLRAMDRDGLVILGGYDVVPPGRRDVLDAALRQKLGDRANKDLDRFWVWSDAGYGDLDGDALAELPISRVPDARDSELFLKALGAPPLQLGERFGIHNVARPFAVDVWQEVAGTRGINATEFFAPKDVIAEEMSSSCHYYMLHGSDEDARTFKGENGAGTEQPNGFEISKVPLEFRGVVFSGCCWGALIIRGKAVDGANSVPPPRMAEESIALAFLKAGAIAFIGCTGSHYSGRATAPDENYAVILHRAFWARLRAGASPARALFEAKREYAKTIVERDGPLDPLDTARRLKNLAQFTCLGLGW